ncbi:MAG: hypothetical protein ABWJ42_06960 [Sulfolobales archaeon]
MGKQRKNIAIDKDIAEKIKIIAKNRGMTLSEYLRKLFRSAISLEEQGIYVPRLLEEVIIDRILSSFKFITIPQDLLDEKNFSKEDYEKARVYGERIGRAFREMFLDPILLIERIGEASDLIVRRGGSMVIMKSDGLKRVIAELIIGIARGGELEISESEYITIINTRSTSSPPEERYL